MQTTSLEMTVNDSYTMLCSILCYTSSFGTHELMILLVAVYCAAKAAVIGMTRADAIDYSPSQIRVNCVCPGLVDTPMLETFEKHVLQRDIAVAPMNRMGTPQEIADVVLFLASSKASFIQGATFVVDGGYTIN